MQQDIKLYVNQSKRTLLNNFSSLELAKITKPSFLINLSNGERGITKSLGGSEYQTPSKNKSVEFSGGIERTASSIFERKKGFHPKEEKGEIHDRAQAFIKKYRDSQFTQKKIPKKST